MPDPKFTHIYYLYDIDLYDDYKNIIKKDGTGGRKFLGRPTNISIKDIDKYVTSSSDNNVKDIPWIDTVCTTNNCKDLPSVPNINWWFRITKIDTTGEPKHYWFRNIRKKSNNKCSGICKQGFFGDKCQYKEPTSSQRCCDYNASQWHALEGGPNITIDEFNKRNIDYDGKMNKCKLPNKWLLDDTDTWKKISLYNNDSDLA